MVDFDFGWDEEELHDKYKVTRRDGKHRRGKKHEHCQYFVLDVTHDKNVIPALLAYAESARQNGDVRLAWNILDMLEQPLESAAAVDTIPLPAKSVAVSK